MPFGGGIDSIVVTEHVRRIGDAALFIMSRPADRFAAIEEPAAVTGLPVVRAEREIDPQLLRSAELGFLNGHVPVTGILSAIAVLAAVLTSRDAVVMSNEWSASIPTLQYQGRPVNHQYSKSAGFEAAFRRVLADAAAGADAEADATPTPGRRRDLDAGVLLLAEGPDRAVGRPGVRRPRAVPRVVPELQQGVLRRPGPPPGPLVRAVRQVLLHRPDPRAVPARRSTKADLHPDRRAAGGSGAGREVPGACSARAPSRSNASARSTSAGPRSCSPRGGRTGPATGCCRTWPPRSPAGPTRRRTRTPPPCCIRSARTSSRPGTDDRSPAETLLVRPARRPGRRLGPGPRGPRQRAQAAVPRG